MRRRTDGHAADLRPLPEHREEPAVEIAVGLPQPAALADPQPGSVQHLEQREVATRKGGGDRVVAGAGELVGPCDRGVEERHRLGRCRDPGQAGLALRGAQRATRVCRKDSRAVEVPEIAANRRDLAGDRAAREAARAQIREIAPEGAPIGVARFTTATALCPRDELSDIVLVRPQGMGAVSAERREEVIHAP